MDLPAKPLPTGIRLFVRLQPRASRNTVVGLYGEGSEVRLKIALSAPPVDNAANRSAQEFLSDVLKVSKGAVRLVGGDKSRDKTFEIQGEPNDLIARLEQLLVGLA